jgi:hypothetical protein
MNQGIELLNGQMFDFFNPSATDVSIDELAHVLSNVCRFAGHVRYFYSVAQHLLNTSLIVDPPHEKAALLHDTSEAFTNDIVTPLKAVVPTFKEIETTIESDMAGRFGFQFPLAPEVKLADLQMLAIEKHILKPFPSHWAILDGIEYEHLLDRVRMLPMTPDEARMAFLQRWEEVR